MGAPDYFQFFGLDPRLSLDLADLENRYYRLSRQLHPDRYLRATPAGRERSLEASTVLNDAYRTLRDPIARAEYLLARQGWVESKQPAPELLDEMFELNMELEQARRAGDLEAVQRKLAPLREQADARLEALFRAYDQAPNRDTLAEVRAALDRRKYIGKLVSQAN